MRLFIPIFAVLLLWTPNSIGDTSHHARHATGVNQQPQDQPVSSGAGGNKHASETAAQQTNNDPRPRYKKPEWIAVILTGIYVTITGYYVVVSHRTMNLILRQGDIAKEAADAAKLSAQAVINSERALLLIEWADSAIAQIDFWARNCGRTPCEILHWHIDTAHPDAGDNLPDVPYYGSEGAEFLHKQWLASGSRVAIASFYGESETPADLWQDVIHSRKRLCYVGRVKYRDMFSKEIHETRFCYFWSPVEGVGLIMCGPSGYNEHT
jgi:hypothetical protein